MTQSDKDRIEKAAYGYTKIILWAPNEHTVKDAFIDGATAEHVHLSEQLQSQAKEIEELLKEIESHKEIEEIYSNADLTRGETSILGPNKEPLFHAEAKVFAALFDELDKADSIQRNKQ